MYDCFLLNFDVHHSGSIARCSVLRLSSTKPTRGPGHAHGKDAAFCDAEGDMLANHRSREGPRAPHRFDAARFLTEGTSSNEFLSCSVSSLGWNTCVVPLWCVLDLSSTGRSPLGVTQRRFAPSGRAQLHFSTQFWHVAPSSLWKCACHFHLASA